jgi:archaeosine synthase
MENFYRSANNHWFSEIYEDITEFTKISSIFIKSPFYLPQFELSCRWIIDEYTVTSHKTAVFIPCTIRKPYNQSSSHKLFHKMSHEVVLDSRQYHVIISGTCGAISTELELMYPYAHNHDMLGNVKYQRIKFDFLRSETRRIIDYLKKTKFIYEKHLAYCIGILRAAMERGVTEIQISVEVYPTHPMIDKFYDFECPFPEKVIPCRNILINFVQHSFV